MTDNNVGEHNKRVRWVSDPNKKGEHLFTFDGKRVFNLFRDYPYELTKEERRIFKEEEPYWAKFFRSRNNPISIAFVRVKRKCRKFVNKQK